MPRRHQAITLLALFAAAVGFLLTAGASQSRIVPLPPAADLPPDGTPTPQQIFAERIMPIFNSPKPSSCTQCHLAGIDLKDYILPSHEKTFRSLRDGGMIDLDRPLESKILKLIQRGDQDDNRSAALIHEKVRQAEYQAFAEWIRACCADDRLRQSPRLTAAEAVAEQAEFEAEVETVAQNNPLLATFIQTIWARQKSCANCHMPGGNNNIKFVAKFGPRVNWMSPQNPAATMNYLIAKQLVDAKQPEKSLLLLKGTAEVQHGGGKKMVKGDECYKDFLAFAQAFAASRQVVTDAKPLPKTDKADKPAAAPAEPRKYVELQVEGLRNVEDNFKLRAALAQVSGVQGVIIDRRANGPSPVRVQYGDKEPDEKALLEAVTKSGYRGSKAGQ